MFLWPALWYSLIIYGITAQFVAEGEKVGTWTVQLIVVLGPGAEMLVGLFLLRREGFRELNQAFRERIRLRWPKGRKKWAIGVAVFAAAYAGTMLVGPLNEKLAAVPGFIPPDWWPALSDPTAEINGIADAYPDIALRGNYLFFIASAFITLVFNIFGEEVYYRGYLLPRMQGAFGKWDWVANGLLFTLKHVYQRWLFPAIAIGGLAFAFAGGPLRSLPLAMAYHWIGNALMATVFHVMALVGV
jgi:membrane protease YdiL (CAAX protease family)